jgi:rhomboid protease GluP
MVAINVIVFFVLSFQGMTEDALFMLEHGAMYVPNVLEGGEYYRLFTSMFLHFGFSHLMNNMLMLLVMGWSLEVELGHVKFVILYLLSGLGGNVLSLGWDIMTHDYAVSAGASGAIFGVIGASLYIAIRNRGRIGDVTGRGLIFMIVLSLYYGYTSGNVDNLAHIGGLAAGFILSILLYRKPKEKYGS